MFFDENGKELIRIISARKANEPVSLRLDNDIVLFFKKRASEQKVPYQTLINTLLRKELQEV